MHIFFSGAIIVLMKKIYLAKIPFTYDLEVLLTQLPLARRAYVDSIRDIHRKSQSIFVWLLFERGFKKDFSKYQRVISDFYCDKSGKWYANDDDKVHFSLSHSGDYVAVSICDDGDTGIDVEVISDKILGAEKYLLQGVEYAVINADKKVFLTKIWTEKECLYKASKNCNVQTTVLDFCNQRYCLSAAFSTPFTINNIIEILDFN